MGVTTGMWQAFGYFLGTFWIYAMYRFGQFVYQECHSRVKVLAIILGMTCLLSFLRWYNLGTHVEDADPMVGGGERAIDYEPTRDQRNAAATFTFLITFLPACASVLRTGEASRSRHESESNSV